MADARLIKKKIAVDDKVSQLSMQSAFIFTWMLLFTDKEGKLVSNPEILKGNCFPFVRELSPEKIEKSLSEIENVGLIIRYSRGNVQYCLFPNFVKNHVPSILAREGASVIPNPDECNPLENKGQEEVKRKSINPKIEFDLDSVFARYPKKSAKQKCLDKMRASVKTDEDFANLNKALTNYIALVEEDRAKGFKDRAWKDAPTFFNNWKDFVEVETDAVRAERAKKVEEERQRKLAEAEEAKRQKFLAENPDIAERIKQLQEGK